MPYFIFYSILFAQCVYFTHEYDDGILIEDVPNDSGAPDVSGYQQEQRKKPIHLGKQFDEVLKPYLSRLKENQELVVSSGTGFAGSSRFKPGDIHIRKGGGKTKSPEVTEAKRTKYTYPYGLGAFLISGCYRYTGIPSDITELGNQKATQMNDFESKRKRRQTNKPINESGGILNYCKTYAKIEPNKVCEKMIPGAYVLGSGFDIKYENSETSRRKNLVNKYCNYAKKFNDHSVPDPITANGIFDTTTQTMTFGASDDYMKYMAARSNLDRYSNVFSSEKLSAYGGANGEQNVSPGGGNSKENSDKGSYKDDLSAKLAKNNDAWLFLIQSSILIYDLILDQITPWSLDPEFLVDFLHLPQSYFYPNAPEEFNKFILRYGTHVVVSAKFGGEFKIIHTMKKSKVSNVESFAQECTTDTLSMFSRSWNANVNLLVANLETSKSESNVDTKTDEAKMKKQKSKVRKSEYASTYISVKGGSQEVAAIVANLNQPDFGDTFIGWLQTVHVYPRAFDFKYESITSILDVDVKLLFTYTGEKDGKLCRNSTLANCEFGTTIQEFEEIWSRKLKALKFAITLYLKEKDGLTMSKFLIPKGDSECRFNILSYLSPYWSEVVSGGQEFRMTFTLDIDQTENQFDELRLKNGDEMFIMKREDFWIAKRKGEKYSYQSARPLNEPFKSLNKTYINLFGLILEYRETDASLQVVDMSKVLNEYSYGSACDFEYRYVNMVTPNGNFTRPFVYLNYNTFEEYDDYRRRRSLFDHENELARCQNLLKIINWNIGNLKNFNPFWVRLWGKIVGILDYHDPIKAVIRTWDLPFAVLPCHLKWSNKLMMVLSKDDTGKCLKFTASTDGEIFVVIATTPSNQKTWYTLQITTKGVIFYRAGRATLLHDDAAAGTTGDENLYQNFFICLSYETRRASANRTLNGLFIQYGIFVDAFETGHLYLSYFDTQPLEPTFYSFGSRNSDIEIFNAHIASLTVEEQIKLRCPVSSKFSKASDSSCDYKCHPACDGCTKPNSVQHCKRCLAAAMLINQTSGEISDNLICVTECPSGFRTELFRNKICYDVDECKEGIHECQTNTDCINTIGSYNCVCKSGFIGNGFFCEDVNECTSDLSNCSNKATCVNLYGSYNCQCENGYIGDGSRCYDLDECALDTHDCLWNTKCVNKIGSYKCVCLDGLEKIDEKCIDIDECKIDDNKCIEKNALCKNTFGSYECVCGEGFVMYEDSCHDNEDQYCLNTYGSYVCICKDGYLNVHNGYEYCVDFNECKNDELEKCATNAVCVNTYGSYKCECLNGFYDVNGTCIDVNECHLHQHDCYSPSTCYNLYGSYKCKCDEGFYGDGKQCEDVNECELDYAVCSKNEVCVNTIGSYICDYYTSESQTMTTLNGKCEIIGDTMMCRCDRGFQQVQNYTEHFICEDIDECSLAQTICPLNSVCANQISTYTCECTSGYVMHHGKRLCEDFDECANTCYNECDYKLEFCINLPGSYKCNCQSGYRLGLNGTCEDINECELVNNCHSNAKCQNTHGSYACQCQNGFYGNGTYCEDTNECLLFNDDNDLCPQYSKCLNTISSFKCVCMNGFRQANQTTFACADVDECTDRGVTESLCDQDSNCQNTIGSYKCKCVNGYTWSNDLNKCVDVNECEGNDEDLCDGNSKCINLMGTYECECRNGWNRTVDNFCDDIDECKLNAQLCGLNSLCHNTPGSYECHCRNGFSLQNWIECIDIDECKQQQRDEKSLCEEFYFKCVNTYGSYSCVCIDGFALNLNGSCQDINECDLNPCDQNSVCVNKLGTYDCACIPGFYHLTPYSKDCFDIDECTDKTKANECDRYASCVNTIGSYRCSCLPGFTGNGTVCGDIDECLSIQNPNEALCNRTGICINTIGYYGCDCLTGYISSVNSNLCIDINECEYETCTSIQNNTCVAFGMCRNLPGSFICDCFEGFEFDINKRQCVDIDECAKLEIDLGMKKICHKDTWHMGTCMNTCGNFTCECQNNDLTLVDIYDPTKCYKRNETREYTFYVYLDRSNVNFFEKNFNITIESCNGDAEYDRIVTDGRQQTVKHEFSIRMTLIDDILGNIHDKHWFPILVQNSNWTHINFICRFELKFNTVYTPVGSFKHVLIEDESKQRCSLYKQTELHKIKNASDHNTKIDFKLETIWDLQSVNLNCEISLKNPIKRKIIFNL